MITESRAQFNICRCEKQLSHLTEIQTYIRMINMAFGLTN